MSITYTQANSLLDLEFGAVSHTAKSNYYLALSTTPIGNDGTGVTEVSGGSYARVTIANNKTSWASAASGTLDNLISFEFPESSASWGTISYVALYDAASGGNILYFGALDSTRAVATATTVLFAAGGISVLMNNS